MHKTMKDGLETITLTSEEWFTLTVGYEKLMRMAKYRVCDGGDHLSFSESIELADILVEECDSIMLVDEWCDKTKAADANDVVHFEEEEDNPCK